MDREILFRGKRIDNGEWVEGSLFFGDIIIPHKSQNMFFNHATIFDKDKNENRKFMTTDSLLEFYIVNSETVGQFTGLTDRNGVKIFEGDILESLNGNRGYVVFKNGAFMKSCNSDMPFLIAEDVNAVIGNIHDNPELIGGDADV